MAAPPEPGTRLYWLGQAGFVIETGGRRIVIDPYLSNTLEAKYAQTPFTHKRMMPAPVSPDELGDVDLVLCTHHHTDHMDPRTLAPLARRLPNLRFVVPAASAALARERAEVGDNRLIPVDAGAKIEPLPGVELRALQAAHETIEPDEGGRCRFLGFSVASGRTSVFHSGDCVPYEGQVEEVARAAPDLALLPVNGRSDLLRRAGFAGNFSIEEALALCVGASVPSVIAHHYGMFAFNTVDPETIDRTLTTAPIHALRARMQVVWTLRPN
jgi:L-ascorbate metabolism protein UlaG (beta-lactamase superfamily)